MTQGLPAQPLKIGDVTLPHGVVLAPMSGITDLPFRQTVHELGTPLVVSEMLASDMLLARKADLLRKAAHGGMSPVMIQLVGREPAIMAEAARLAQDMGADILDINMGCPARKLTGGLSGAALMREPKRALAIAEAVVAAVSVPVTVKMRLGWDDKTRNAPWLAVRLAEVGVRLITVHGRTRNQFYAGRADWEAIGEVTQAVSLPVLANGDITDPKTAAQCLARSGAHGVMIGRAARGRPWLLQRIARYLATGHDPGDPPLSHQREVALTHYRRMLHHYGTALGVRVARKHLGWYVAAAAPDAATEKRWRARLCRQDDPARVMIDLGQFYDSLCQEAA